MAKFTLDTARAIWREVTRGGHFDDVMKTVKLVSCGEGRAVAELTVEEKDTNRGGTLHGGLTSTLIDSVSTMGLMTTKDNLPGVSVDLNVSFMKAAKIGETVVIESETVRCGQSLAFLKVTLRNKQTGDVIAMGSHTKFLQPPKNKL